MSTSSNTMISDFTDKPRTQAYFEAVDEFVATLGEAHKDVTSQVSYSVNRKFLWLWAYEKTSDGTLYLNVTLDREITDDRIHDTTRTSTNRWNHHVEVRSARTARSAWLRDLITAGYQFAG